MHRRQPTVPDLYSSSAWANAQEFVTQEIFRAQLENPPELARYQLDARHIAARLVAFFDKARLAINSPICRIPGVQEVNAP